MRHYIEQLVGGRTPATMPHTSEQGGGGGGGSREARSLTPLPSAWTPEVSLPVRPGSSMATMAMAAEQLQQARCMPQAHIHLHAPPRHEHALTYMRPAPLPRDSAAAHLALTLVVGMADLRCTTALHACLRGPNMPPVAIDVCAACAHCGSRAPPRGHARGPVAALRAPARPRTGCICVHLRWATTSRMRLPSTTWSLDATAWSGVAVVQWLRR